MAGLHQIGWGRLIVAGAIALTLSAMLVHAQSRSKKKAYGIKSDVVFAKALWKAMHDRKIVGPNRIHVHAFKGKRPHGAIQQSYATTVKVNHRDGRVVVKANHPGKGVSMAKVYDKPNKYLNSYTVMFQREAGYDPENQNWFWVKYSPKGNVDRDGSGVSIAGRVGIRNDYGCVGCHRTIGGTDFEALTSK